MVHRCTYEQMLKTHKLNPKRKKIKVNLSIFIGKNFSGVNHLRAFVLVFFFFFLFKVGQRDTWAVDRARVYASSFLLPDNCCALVLAGEEAR